MITSYTFGCMEIKGRAYRKDLILFADGTVLDGWWRRSGHVLSMVDLQGVLAWGPDVLVVGTGSPGMLQPENNLCRELGHRGVSTQVLPTKDAIQEYNTLHGRGRKVAGCFHLTC